MLPAGLDRLVVEIPHASRLLDRRGQLLLFPLKRLLLRLGVGWLGLRLGLGLGLGLGLVLRLDERRTLGLGMGALLRPQGLLGGFVLQLRLGKGLPNCCVEFLFGCGSFLV